MNNHEEDYFDENFMGNLNILGKQLRETGAVSFSLTEKMSAANIHNIGPENIEAIIRTLLLCTCGIRVDVACIFKKSDPSASEVTIYYDEADDENGGDA